MNILKQIKRGLNGIIKDPFRLKSQKNNTDAFDRGFLKGYEQAREEYEDRIDRIVDDRYSERHWLVNPNKVIYVSPSGNVYLGNEVIQKDVAQRLREEARYIDKTYLWEIFQETVKQQAIDKAVIKSTNFEHVLGGKLMIHNLGILKNIVERIKKI